MYVMEPGNDPSRIFRSGDILDVFTRWFGGVTSRPNVLIGAVYLLGALPD
jgi:hypothetical protein